jgi:mono/diheme cytochrome c family protein
MRSLPIGTPRWHVGHFASAVVLCLAMTGPAAVAQEPDRLANDMALPMDDPAAVAAGRERFGALCSVCHGAKGRGGGKGAPCLTCGRFRHGGKASELYAHISRGIPGTLMGAFGTTLEDTEILNVIAFIRTHTAERRAAGEIE